MRATVTSKSSDIDVGSFRESNVELRIALDSDMASEAIAPGDELEVVAIQRTAGVANPVARDALLVEIARSFRATHPDRAELLIQEAERLLGPVVPILKLGMLVDVGPRATPMRTIVERISQDGPATTVVELRSVITMGPRGSLLG